MQDYRYIYAAKATQFQIIATGDILSRSEPFILRQVKVKHSRFDPFAESPIRKSGKISQ